MPDNTNQRVTNAVLKKDIETLGNRVGEMRDELREDKKQRAKEMRADKERTTKRMAVVESHVIKCSTLWDEHKQTHQTIDEDIKDVEGDVKKWSLFGGGGGGFLAVLVSFFLDR